MTTPRATTPPSPHAARMARLVVWAVQDGAVTERDDLLAGEEPLEIRAAGPDQAPVPVAVTMRTPGHEADLAVGFLFSEGLIDGDEVVDVRFADPAMAARPDDTVTVHLARWFDPSAVATRNFVANASCGLCGKAAIEDVERRTDPLPPGPVVDATVVAALSERMRPAQEVFDATGGLHAAALFSSDGELRALREDVGRHNALDAVVGARVRVGAVPLHDTLLQVSGRVSFEIVQKAAVAGIPIVCAVSAPTDLAVRTAERLGQTLIGFVRGDRFNVYTHPERVALP